jgi:hypothetical protein
VLVSEREASSLFGERYLSREQARMLLRTGVAGAGERLGPMTLPRCTDVMHGVRFKVWGPMPWVVTVSGMALFGAEASGWCARDDGNAEFSLQPPGSCFELVKGRWFGFGPGRHWFFWDPTRLPQ